MVPDALRFRRRRDTASDPAVPTERDILVLQGDAEARMRIFPVSAISKGRAMRLIVGIYVATRAGNRVRWRF
jgi:hypothetical protein